MIRPRKNRDLTDLTRRELVALAREKGVKGYSRLRKAELVTCLEALAEAPEAARSLTGLVAWDGGPAEHAIRLAQALEAEGAEVHLFVRSAGEERRADDPPFVHRVAANEEDDVLSAAAAFGEAAAAAIRVEEERVGRTFDVLHVHDWTGAEVLRELEVGDRRVFVTLHSTEPVRRGDRPGPLSSAIEEREREAARRADRVIVMDEATRAIAADRYEVSPDDIVLLLEPFPVERFSGELADPGEIKARYAVGPVDPLTLFLGPLDPDHGADVLLEAIPEVLSTEPQARFVFVGDGEMADALRHRTRELGLEGVIRLLGHREGAEVEDLVRAADLVVVPSRRPTSDGPVLCAWSARRPVVVTEEGASEVVREPETGYFSRAEPKAVAACIRRVFEDWDEARRMGEQGREALDRTRSWPAFANRILRSYATS